MNWEKIVVYGVWSVIIPVIILMIITSWKECLLGFGIALIANLIAARIRNKK